MREIYLMLKFNKGLFLPFLKIISAHPSNLELPNISIISLKSVFVDYKKINLLRNIAIKLLNNTFDL